MHVKQTHAKEKCDYVIKDTRFCSYFRCDKSITFVYLLIQSHVVIACRPFRAQSRYELQLLNKKSIKDLLLLLVDGELQSSAVMSSLTCDSGVMDTCTAVLKTTTAINIATTATTALVTTDFTAATTATMATATATATAT